MRLLSGSTERWSHSGRVKAVVSDTGKLCDFKGRRMKMVMQGTTNLKAVGLSWKGDVWMACGRQGPLVPQRSVRSGGKGILMVCGEQGLPP